VIDQHPFLVTDGVAACAICGAPSATRPDDPLPIPSGPQTAPLRGPLPRAELCDWHRSAWQSDWLILGWCVDHYGEALRHCHTHGAEIEPL
jgi:hypothetical protein